MAKEVYIDWKNFQQRYIRSNTIFVEDQENKYILQTSDDNFIVICEVPKFEEMERNILFETSYLMKQNIIKIIPQIEEVEDDNNNDDSDRGSETDSDNGEDEAPLQLE